MGRDRLRPSSANYGVQAGGNIYARAMAIGDGATATSYGASTQDPDLHHAIAELQRKLSELDLQPQQRRLLDQDVAGLETAASGDRPDLSKAEAHVTGIKDKLTMAGVLLGKVAAILEPVSKIIEVLKVPLGLG